MNLPHALISTFLQTFDTKDWGLMESCLADEIWVDYSSFRGTEPHWVFREAYIAQRRSGTHHLDTKHSIKITSCVEKGGLYVCEGGFEIERFTPDKSRFFHSYGTYIFDLEKYEGAFKIKKIVQKVSRNEGEPSIHGAFL